MDEKLLEKLDELIQELSCMNANLESISGNLEVLVGCVDVDEGKTRLRIDGCVAKYDPVAAHNAQAVQQRMASVVEKKEDNYVHNQGKIFVVEPREQDYVQAQGKMFTIEPREQEVEKPKKIEIRREWE